MFARLTPKVKFQTESEVHDMDLVTSHFKTMLSMDSTTSLLGISSETVQDLRNTHANRVLKLMNEHRKACSKLCDVEIIVDDVHKIVAHRSVLAACSPYFYAMFNGELMESKQRVVHLKDVQKDMLELLIDFAYTGHIDVTVENAQPLLSLASQFNFPEVRAVCCKFLEIQLDASNCIGIRNFAEENGCMRFLDEVDHYVIEHFSEVIQSDEFLAMPHALLTKCLASSDLNVNGEKHVYEATLKWVKHDLVNREDLLTTLLEHIRLPLLPVNYLLDEVDNEPLMRTSHGRRDFLDEAKNCHLLSERPFRYRSIRTRPRKSFAGTLFAVGGKVAGETITTKVECYSGKLNLWRPVTPLSVPRHQLGVTELNGHIFAVGGSDGVSRLETVEHFSPSANEWTYAKSLNTCRSGIGICANGDTIVCCGGYDGRLCLSSVERYDPRVDEWTDVTSMNVKRSFPGVAVLRDRIYVIGGNDGSFFLSSCEVFDPLSGKWLFTAPMNKPRAGLGAAVLDGLLYVAGGFDGISRLDSVEVYDPRANEWSMVAPMISCRDGLCMRQYGGWLYAIGGIDGPSYLNSVELYDPVEDKWEDVVQMRSSRASAGAAVLPNLLDLEFSSSH